MQNLDDLEQGGDGVGDRVRFGGDPAAAPLLLSQPPMELVHRRSSPPQSLPELGDEFKPPLFIYPQPQPLQKQNSAKHTEFSIKTAVRLAIALAALTVAGIAIHFYVRNEEMMSTAIKEMSTAVKEMRVMTKEFAPRATELGKSIDKFNAAVEGINGTLLEQTSAKINEGLEEVITIDVKKVRQEASKIVETGTKVLQRVSEMDIGKEAKKIEKRLLRHGISVNLRIPDDEEEG